MERGLNLPRFSADDDGVRVSGLGVGLWGAGGVCSTTGFRSCLEGPKLRHEDPGPRLETSNQKVRKATKPSMAPGFGVGRLGLRLLRKVLRLKGV